MDVGEGPFAGFEGHLNVLKEVAQPLLLREHIQKYILFCFQELLAILLIILQSSFEVVCRFLSVSLNIVDNASDQPQLVHILLGDRFDNVVQLLQCFLEVAAQQMAQRGVKAEFVDVQRAKTDVAKICLAAVMAHAVSFTVDIALPSR